MRFLKHALVIFACAATPVVSVASPLFTSHHITIVGETHHHPDSTVWFLKAVSEYVEGYQCLNVALEIGSDQQDIINEAMSEDASVSAIRISSIIDHPSYRKMISGFKALKSDGRCLKVYAIDAPLSINRNRDEWMLKRIKEVDDESIPWVVLIGSLHALKQVNWYPEANGKPFLAELLQGGGYDVFSIIQDWTNQECTERSSEYVSDVREPIYHLLEPVAAYRPEAPHDAIDAAIVWKCP